jgi:DoxX
MDVGLVLIHAVIGTFVAAHGSQKLFGILGGYGLEGTGKYLEGFGLRPGKLFALAAGSAELLGGLALAAGFSHPARPPRSPPRCSSPPAPTTPARASGSTTAATSTR